MSAFFAFLHHIAAFGVVAALMIEFVLIKGEINLRNAQILLRADSIFGVLGPVVLVIGILRVIYFEKGSDYYLHSGPFIAKIVVFLTVGLLSLYPKGEFTSWRAAINQGQAPAIDAATLKTLRLVLHLELVGVTVLILMAAMMARGIGMFE